MERQGGSNRTAHLICFREPNPAVLKAIRDEWPDKHRVELSDTQILVAHRNGGNSVYDRIQTHLKNENDVFKALIIRVGKAHYGYESRSLWAWLEERT